MLSVTWKQRKMKLKRSTPTLLRLIEIFLIFFDEAISSITLSPMFQNGACRYDSSEGVVGVTGYTDVASEDEDALLDAVATVGPSQWQWMPVTSAFRLKNKIMVWQCV